MLSGTSSLLVFLTAMRSDALLAYVGPGLGAGVIAFLGGIVFSLFLTLFAVIYYPIKRLLRTYREKQERIETTDLETN